MRCILPLEKGTCVGSSGDANIYGPSEDSRRIAHHTASFSIKELTSDPQAAHAAAAQNVFCRPDFV